MDSEIEFSEAKPVMLMPALPIQQRFIFSGQIVPPTRE